MPGDPANYHGDIYASRDERTRFRIRLRNESLPKGTPMVGDDDVYITLVSDDKYVTVEPDGKLVISAKPEVHKFSDFQNGFIARGAVAQIFKTDSGEKWELV